MVTKMIFKTTKFGEVEINEDLIFDFIEPILGYENLKTFALVDHMPDSPFKWLQSLEDANLALPITIPSFFNIDYEFVIADRDEKKLEIKSAEEILTLNIVNIPNGQPQNATINLIGPLVVNINTKKAMQLVLVDTNYSVRHKLFTDSAIYFKKEAEEKKEPETKK